VARPAKTTHKLDVKINLRISAPMSHEMKHAARKLGKEDAEALRDAATIGFRILRMIEWDVNGVIIEKALGINWRDGLG
jgi:hypothetical protein